MRAMWALLFIGWLSGGSGGVAGAAMPLPSAPISVPHQAAATPDGETSATSPAVEACWRPSHDETALQGATSSATGSGRVLCPDEMPANETTATTAPMSDGACFIPGQAVALSLGQSPKGLEMPALEPPLLEMTAGPDLLAPEGRARVPTPNVAPPPAPAPDDLSEINRRILVEITLAPERRGDFEAIRQAFEAMSISRIHRDFLRLGHPPRNIVFGKAVPAETAREAIRLARVYNRGITKILPERRFIPHYIGIGTSAFDELVQVPIAPADVERLANPSLSTEAFHRLYRCLTGEDRKGPALPC